MIKVEAYKIKGWKETVLGVLLEENDQWILINEISMDYQLDGFAILSKKFVKKRSTKKWEKQIAQVLELKKYKPQLDASFKFGSFEQMAGWIEEKFVLLQFQDDIEASLEIGKIDTIEDNILHLLFLKADGKFKQKYTYEYKVNSIRKINFNTDYLNSLLLLAKHNSKI